MSVTSPSTLSPRPKRKRSRRRNQSLVLLLAVSLLVVGGVIVYTFHKRATDQQIAQAAAEDHTQGAAPADSLLNSKQSPTTSPPGTTPHVEGRPAAAQQSQPALNFAEEDRKRRWQVYYQLLAQDMQQQAEASGKALSGETSVQLQSDAQTGGTIAVPGVPGAPGAGLPIAGTDAGAQAEKRAWLGQEGDPYGLSENLPGSLHGMKLDTIMAGTAI